VLPTIVRLKVVLSLEPGDWRSEHAATVGGAERFARAARL